MTLKFTPKEINIQIYSLGELTHMVFSDHCFLYCNLSVALLSCHVVFEVAVFQIHLFKHKT